MEYLLDSGVSADKVVERMADFYAYEREHGRGFEEEAEGSEYGYDDYDQTEEEATPVVQVPKMRDAHTTEMVVALERKYAEKEELLRAQMDEKTKHHAESTALLKEQLDDEKAHNDRLRHSHQMELDRLKDLHQQQADRQHTIQTTESLNHQRERQSIRSQLQKQLAQQQEERQAVEERHARERQAWTKDLEEEIVREFIFFCINS